MAYKEKTTKQTWEIQSTTPKLIGKSSEGRLGMKWQELKQSSLLVLGVKEQKEWSYSSTLQFNTGD